VKRIAVVIHDVKPHAGDAAREFAKACLEHGVETISVAGDELPEGVEAVVGVGGDGTVLRAAALGLREGIPVAGINVGRVGYLAEFGIGKIETFAAALAADRCRVFPASVRRIPLNSEDAWRCRRPCVLLPAMQLFEDCWLLLQSQEPRSLHP